MNIYNLKPFIFYRNIIVPPTPPHGKKSLAIAFFGENVEFLDVVNRLKIPVNRIKYVFVPRITRLIGFRLLPDYKKSLRKYSFIPVTSDPTDFSYIPKGKNFFIDINSPLNILFKKFVIYNFKTNMAIRRMSFVMNMLYSIPNDYEKVLLYAICVDEHVRPTIYDKKFFAIYRMIYFWMNNKGNYDIPFDKVILFFYRKGEGRGRYVLLFDKNIRNNLSFIKTVMTRLNFPDESFGVSDEDSEIDFAAEDIVNNTDLLKDVDKKDDEFYSRTVGVVRDYLKNNKNELYKFSNISRKYSEKFISNVAVPVDEKEKEYLDKEKKSKSLSINISPKDSFLRALKDLKNISSKRKESNKEEKKEEEEKKEVKDIKVFDQNEKIVEKDSSLKKLEDKLSLLRNKILVKSILYKKFNRNIPIEDSSIKSVLSKGSSLYPKLSSSIKREVMKLLPREKPVNVSRNPIIKNSNVEKIIENVSPSHVFKKRVDDFENLKEDIIRCFSLLSNKKYPLKIKKITYEKYKGDVSEVEKSDLVLFKIELIDKYKHVHEIELLLPYIDEYGFFLMNGNKRIITYQLVVHPIFFFEPYKGMFTSAYAMITIEFKRMKKLSYFDIYIGGESIPLIVVLSYLYGFYKVMKDYKIKYEFSDKPLENYKSSYKVGKNLYINFNFSDEVGEGLVSVFSIISKYLEKDFKKEDIKNKELWENIILKIVKNRNYLYVLEQIVNNIVTPIEVSILRSKGQPTKLYDIIKYICEKAITGYYDKRNSLENQRIRSVEIISSLLIRLVMAAYNEYESKVSAGDLTAKLYIDPKKVLSTILTSQNVCLLEYINPVEELSSRSRVTYIGIGGLSSVEGMPTKYLDIHPSYYGNIDPLETSSGHMIGIQQHLSLGSAITNVYGSFMKRDRKNVKSNEIISVTTSMIPFVESDEGARVIMATNQMKQAVPLMNPDIPAVQTGFESVFTKYLSDAFVKKAPASGKVVKVTSENIYIRSNDGKSHVVNIDRSVLRSGQGKHGLSIFRPLVTENSYVKKGDIIAEGSCVKDGVISLGLNLLAAYMPWKGYNFEDGMVVSEDVAERFSSLHIEEEEAVLKYGEKVLFISDVGIDTEKGDIILTYAPNVEDVESYIHLRSPGGRIIKIEVYSNLKDVNVPDKLKKYFEEFRKEYIKKYGFYPIGEFKVKGEKIQGILVRFYIQQVLKLFKGDKLNNRHFNKGVVAIIEKKENMPITPWGERIEIIYNPLAIINRMISGQILELHCGLISKRLFEIMVKSDKKEFINVLRMVLPLLDGSKDKIYSKSLIDYFVKLSSSDYDTLVEKMKNVKFFPLIFPPFKSPSRENILEALRVLKLNSRYRLFIPEFNSYSDPVPVGYVYVMKLEHLSEKKLHSRSTGTYSPLTMLPTRGKSKGGGQRFGEYDAYTCIAWDAPHIVDEMMGPLSVDHVTKNEIISEIIKKGESSFRLSKVNKVKEMMVNYFLAINLNILGGDLYNFLEIK